jgi:predicted O-methyltransferase YrrM
MLFIYHKLINIFLKNKIKREKNLSRKILKSLNITSNFFSQNSYNFFCSFKNFNEKFSYLEIGSYEGCSAVYVHRRFKPKSIYCVDIWKDTNEGYNVSNFNLIESNFDKNTKNISSIKKIKKTSDYFFSKNKILFDVIYIDGYHYGPQVFKDCINSWKFLKKKGILICDDYIWNYYKIIRNNPCYAINKFLKEIKNQYKIVMISNSQISIKKY